MDIAAMDALVGALIALLGVAIAAIGLLTRRVNGKNNANPSIGAHLVKIEALGEQQVEGLRELRTTLGAIQVTLGKLETTVGACGAVQEFRQRGN